MKDFFAVILDFVVRALLKGRDGLKSFHIKNLAADIVRSFKSFFSSSGGYDGSGLRKKIIIAGSVAVILVGIVCIKLFWPSSSGGQRIELTAPTTQDEGGDIWSLQLLKGQPSQIVAQAGVKPGPPLLVKPEAAVQGRMLEVGVMVQGQAGEKYVPGVQKNAEWQPPPKFRLVSEAGKVLAEGQFEYG